MQDANRKHCSQCGHPLSGPAQIYRREADGTWSPVTEIDLSELAPKPLPPRRKFNRKKVAALVLLVILPGVALDIWVWRIRVRAAHKEANEILQYLHNPVGRIVPRFQLRYQRSQAGDLAVAGQTNLPDGTLVEVQVYAGQLLVAMDYPVTVRGGQFQTRSMLQRGRPFALAMYRARIGASFEPRAQPPSVLRVVGQRGERLDGPHVQRTVAAHGATLEFTENFALAE